MMSQSTTMRLAPEIVTDPSLKKRKKKSKQVWRVVKPVDDVKKRDSAAVASPILMPRQPERYIKAPLYDFF